MGTHTPDRERHMSEPIPEATPPVVPATPVPDPPKPTAPSEPDKAPKDWQAEAEKWKAFARKHEDSAKANADKASRFDEFEEANKTEMQKAADRATAAEAKVAEFESRTLRAEVAASKGIPAALLSGSTKEELEASADALLAFRGEKTKPDFGGGDRGGDVTAKGKQLYQSDLSGMTPQAIEAARIAGQLDNLMQGKTS